MEFSHLLSRLGLSPKESRIYLGLLQSGPVTVAVLAKHAGLHRPVIYQYLPHLVERGLVSRVVKGKRTLFAAESPEKLKAMIDELKENFDNALPELDQLYRNKSNRPIVKFFEGKQGITAVLSDLVHSLKKHDVFYRYSSRKSVIAGDKYFPPHYREIRDRKQLERFVITNEDVRLQKKNRLERSIKVVPKEYGAFDYGIVEFIYGGKIAFIDYNTETVTVIENATIAEFQKKIFKILYDRLP